MVGHKAHGQGNRFHGDDAYGDGDHGDGVHGDGGHGDDAREEGVCEEGAREAGAHEEGVLDEGVHDKGIHDEGVHGDGAPWNYDYEGVHGSHWCQSGGDDILTLEGATVEKLLPEMVVCLLEEVGIQMYVACGDDGDL